MLVKEMHIQFSLGLQKIGANSRRKFYDEEVDVFLNKAVEEFVADQVKETSDERGFQKIQVDLDKIRPLIVRDARIPAYLVEEATQWREYKLRLPGDYSYLISDLIFTAKDCSEVVSAQESRYALRMRGPDTLASTDHYAQVEVVDNTLTLDISADIPDSLYSGFSSKAEKFRAIELLLELFYEKRKLTPALQGYQLYWEKAGELYYPGHLLLLKDNNSATTLTIDAAVNIGTSSNVGGIRETAEAYLRYPSRLTKASAIDNVLTTPFYGPLPKSPVSTITDGVLRIYSNPSYIVNMASLTYIRRPAKINLSLQRNCELAADFHPQIVDKAVAIAAGKLEQTNLYQTQTLENERNK